MARHRRDQRNFNLQTAPLRSDSQAPATGASLRDESEAPSDGANISENSVSGKIEVSSRAIAHLASRTAQRSYGVVGFVSRHARPGWAELLHREDVHKGVQIVFSEGRVVIDLYVVIEYGTRISEVARNIMGSVKFAVESALGVPVVQVNVNVQDIRVNK